MSTSKLIVNYLPQCLTQNDLYNMFVTIGPIESCLVMKDNKTGYSYGFGFVQYANSEDAEAAIKQLNGFEVYNKRIKVSFARPPGESIKDTNLYITNLPRHYTEEDLEKHFKPFGTIVQKHILCDKVTGRSRGIAFVRFDKREEAQCAIQHLDGQILENLRLGVCLAKEYGKQRAAFYLGSNVGLTQVSQRNEITRLNRTRDHGSINGTGFTKRNNTFKSYQRLPGAANINRSGFSSRNNTYSPFQGANSDATESNVGFGSKPLKFLKNQIRFNPFAFRMSH